MITVDPFPGLPWRRRLLIVLLAVGTAITVVLTLLAPPGGVKRKAPLPPADMARCVAGQVRDCVGGQADVIMAPAVPAAPAAPPSAPR